MDRGMEPDRAGGDRDNVRCCLELKNSVTAEGVIVQIRARNYPEVLKGYGAEILLVGISYEKGDPGKKHRCVIEKAP